MGSWSTTLAAVARPGPASHPPRSRQRISPTGSEPGSRRAGEWLHCGCHARRDRDYGFVTIWAKVSSRGCDRRAGVPSADQGALADAKPAHVCGSNSSLLFIVFASIASSRVRIVPAILAVSEGRRAHHRSCEGCVERFAYLRARGAAPPYAPGSSRNRQQHAVGSCVPPLFTSRRSADPSGAARGA